MVEKILFLYYPCTSHPRRCELFCVVNLFLLDNTVQYRAGGLDSLIENHALIRLFDWCASLQFLVFF